MFQGRDTDFWNMGDAKGRVEFEALEHARTGPVLADLQGPAPLRRPDERVAHHRVAGRSGAHGSSPAGRESSGTSCSIYGRTAADDAGFEAAYLAKEIGRPVRVQWMRNEETAWDTKGPAFVFNIRGGLDANGNLVALDYDARAADFYHVGYNEHDTVLIAQLMGARRPKPLAGWRELAVRHVHNPEPPVRSRHVVSMPLGFETPVRTGNLRDPNGPQMTFASESFIDELAAAAKADPVQFRLRLFERADG